MKLRGFPEEISEHIELPSIAELLAMPIFFDNSVEDVLKYGTDFQKKLLELTPLRKTKKNISILCQVRLLIPSYRSCTAGHTELDYSDNEWHIDCEENEDGEHIYHEERDIVHLLSNDVSCLTEFNTNPEELNWNTDKPYDEFFEMIRANAYILEPKKMPPNRIVTFTNHFHRAINSTKPEFRFMWRVVETDRKRETSKYNKNFKTSIVGVGNNYEENISQKDSIVTIHLPSKMDIGHVELLPEYGESSVEAIKNLKEFIDYDNPNKFNGFALQFASWNSDGIKVEGRNFSDRVALYSNYDASSSKDAEAVDVFFRSLGINRFNIQMVESTDERNFFTIPVSEYFNGINTVTGQKVVGVILNEFGKEDAKHLNSNMKYKFKSTSPQGALFKLEIDSECNGLYIRGNH